MNSLSVNVSFEQIDLLITVTLFMLIFLNTRNLSATCSLILSLKLLSFFLSLTHIFLLVCIYVLFVCLCMVCQSRKTIPFVSFTSLCVLGNLTST